MAADHQFNGRRLLLGLKRHNHLPSSTGVLGIPQLCKLFKVDPSSPCSISNRIRQFSMELAWAVSSPPCLGSLPLNTIIN
ncbi:hypothetical protein J6590_001800 [Homalodisca vitripennis]|nr:hypothetical protein J6590_001800 [Homalodisca vitripennis]